jgi:hypothetical protein
MCGSTSFGCLHAYHQLLTTALTTSGFTVGALVVAALFVVFWSANRSDHDQQRRPICDVATRRYDLEDHKYHCSLSLSRDLRILRP